MIGLAILIFFGLYLLIAIWVTKKAINWAKANNRRPWVWGGFAAFLMYSLVFWDFIPTLFAQRYYCSTQAGFWTFKTPEQWILENPGVEETLKESLSPTRLRLEKPTHEKTWVNQRFYIEITERKILLSLNLKESKFFDAKNGELIAKSINFYRGVGNVLAMGGTWDQWRQQFSVSLGNRGCGEEGKSSTDMFDIYIYQFWKSGQNK